MIQLLDFHFLFIRIFYFSEAQRTKDEISELEETAVGNYFVLFLDEIEKLPPHLLVFGVYFILDISVECR